MILFCGWCTVYIFIFGNRVHIDTEKLGSQASQPRITETSSEIDVLCLASIIHSTLSFTECREWMKVMQWTGSTGAIPGSNQDVSKVQSATSVSRPRLHIFIEPLVIDHRRLWEGRRRRRSLVGSKTTILSVVSREQQERDTTRSKGTSFLLVETSESKNKSRNRRTRNARIF